jgi:predicted nucleic acid-binding protein
MKTKRPRTPVRAQSVPAFWDSSAIIQLCCQQPQSTATRQSARTYNTQIVWWGTVIETFSSIYRLTRESGLTVKEGQAAVKALAALQHKWNEIPPSESLASQSDHRIHSRCSLGRQISRHRHNRHQQQRD